MATKTTAKTAPKKGTSIVKWDEKFSSYAKKDTEQAAAIGAGGKSIKFGPGSITVDGGTMPGGKMEAIIVGWCYFNGYYDGPYDPDNLAPPVCYAFNTDAKNMVPHAEVTNRQSPECTGCPQNEFGSALTRRGKACGNNIRLALIPSKDADSGAAVNTAELYTAKISPTGLKGWKGYVDAVADSHNRPAWSVITEIICKPHHKNQLKLEFNLVDPIEDDDILTALEKRVGKVQEVLQQPFSPAIERAAPVRKAKPNAKFAGKGKR